MKASVDSGRFALPRDVTEEAPRSLAAAVSAVTTVLSEVFSEVYDDVEGPAYGMSVPTAMSRPATQKRLARLSGLTVLGNGRHRVALALDRERVLKLPIRSTGSHSNRAELRRWQGATIEQARHLMPVLAADPEGTWLVMARSEGALPELELGLVALAARLGVDDAHPRNWGTYRGRPVLLDYAESVSPFAAHPALFARRANPALRIVADEGMGGWSIVVRAMRGSKRVGRVTVVSERQMSFLRPGVEEHCGAALRAAEAEAGRRLTVFVVDKAYLDESEQNQRIGVAMYARAAQVAAGLGGVLVPYACSSSGGTSLEAQRLWRSRSLAELVAVYGGRLAYGGPEVRPGSRPV